MTPDQQQIILYTTDDGQVSIALFAQGGTIRMNQQQLAELFATSKQNISFHIQNILKEGELSQNSVVKDYLTTDIEGQTENNVKNRLIHATDGKQYFVRFYSLDMVLAVGFRVKSKRGIQFRQRANQHLKDYLVKGFVIDSERLKNPDGRPDYFDELLEKIRDIRASEKRFYQKVRDLFSLSSDYDPDDKATQMFFAEAQNKILYAVTGNTAAEIVVQRADETKPNMALTSRKGNIVRKQDIYIAKNYLTADELDTLNRFVVVFLEAAELRVKSRKDITIAFRKEHLDRILIGNDKEILDNKGKISNQEMEAIVDERYENFNTKRKQREAQKADIEDLQELEELEKNLNLLQ